MELFKKILADGRMRMALLGCTIFGGAILVVAWKMGVDLAMLKQAWKVTESFLVAHPGVLFLAIVILPGLPVPTSALMLTAGLVWRDRPWMACLLCLLALGLNMTWTYWLAARPARGLVEKLMVATSIKIPDLPRGDHLKLILVLRLTPGIPLFFQNYLLGFLRAPFFLYLTISMLCTGFIGSGVVLSGAGLSDGRLLPALTGISLIVLGLVFTHLIRGWLAKKKLATDEGARG